jgi:hypothetical protein
MYMATPSQAKKIVINVSKLVFLMSTGKLLSSIQQAIANVNPEDEMQVHLSELILKGIQTAFENHGMLQLNQDSDDPVIPAGRAFSVRGDE